MDLVEPIRDRKEIEAMKKFLKERNLRDYMIFTLGINSKLKVNDLLKLRVSDIFDEKGEILINVSPNENRKEDKIFPFSDTVIRDYTEDLMEYFKKYFVDALPGAAMFPSRKGGGPITRQQAHRIIINAAKAVGIKDNIGAQSLRKTFEHLTYITLDGRNNLDPPSF